MSDKQNSITVDLGELENTCFVIIPFNELYQSHYETIIRPAVEKAGLHCVKGDEIYSKPRIMDDIWKAIRSSRLVIAELTGKNPNVFYEVGLAHAIGKPVIILTREEDDVPFDLRSLRYLYYNTNDPFWGEKLVKGLHAMIKQVIKSDGFSDYLEGVSKSGELDFPVPEQTADLADSHPLTQFDLTGFWQGTLMTPGRMFEISLKINQNGQDISGTMTMRYKLENVTTIVQQDMVGIINGNQVTLTGVNFNFIEQGLEKTYYLDSWALIVMDDGRYLDGKGVDEAETSTQVQLSKVKN